MGGLDRGNAIGSKCKLWYVAAMRRTSHRPKMGYLEERAFLAKPAIARADAKSGPTS